MAGASGPGRTARGQVLLSGRRSFGLSRIIPALTAAKAPSARLAGRPLLSLQSSCGAPPCSPLSRATFRNVSGIRSIGLSSSITTGSAHTPFPRRLGRQAPPAPWCSRRSSQVGRVLRGGQSPSMMNCIVIIKREDTPTSLSWIPVESRGSSSFAEIGSDTHEQVAIARVFRKPLPFLSRSTP